MVGLTVTSARTGTRSVERFFGIGEQADAIVDPPFDAQLQDDCGIVVDVEVLNKVDTTPDQSQLHRLFSTSQSREGDVVAQAVQAGVAKTSVSIVERQASRARPISLIK